MCDPSVLARILLVATLACCASTTAGNRDVSAEQATAVREYLARDMILVTAPALENYLDDIARKLLATRSAPSPAPRFLIQSTAEFSVFTDTRGNIVVGTETLRRVESEDELAAALSHELAHVIANDAQTKNVIQKLPNTVETSRAVSLAVDGRSDKGNANSGELSSFASGDLATTQAAGTVWTDLVAPGWNRQQEREADLAGVDMARAAGYDPAAFSTLFARLDAAQATRSARVEKLRQDAIKRAQSKATTPKTSLGDELQGSLKSQVETSAVEAAFEGLAGWGTDYDTPEQRTTAVLEHVQKTSTGRRDKTPRSPRFDAELRGGQNQQLLSADQAALTVMAAVNSREPQAARAAAESLLAGPAQAPLSPHLNLAIGTWLDAVAGKPAEAEQRASAWIGSELAPRAAYLWRASYQIQQRNFSSAMATLELGADRFADRGLFLPQMIAVARNGGDLPRADELGMECARSGTGLNMASVNKLLDLTQQESGNKPTGLYADCVAALGYDPVQRRGQALEIKPAAGPNPVPAVRDKLRKLFGQ